VGDLVVNSDSFFCNALLTFC